MQVTVWQCADFVADGADDGITGAHDGSERHRVAVHFDYVAKAFRRAGMSQVHAMVFFTHMALRGDAPVRDPQTFDAKALFGEHQVTKKKPNDDRIPHSGTCRE